MEPVTTIGGAFSIGHHAASLLKGIAETIKASGKAEGLSDLIDLQMVMLELIQKHHEQILENVQQREQIRELDNKLKTARALEFDHERGFYILREDGKTDSAFCPTCYDNQKKEIRLHPVKHGSSDGCHAYCHVCNGRF